MERQQATGNQTAQEVSVKLKSSVAKTVQFNDAREELRFFLASGMETARVG